MSPSAITKAVPLPPSRPVPKFSTHPVITPSSILPKVASDTVPAWVQPDLSRLLQVEHNPGSYASRSVSLVNVDPGAIFSRISSPTPATCAYSSVQASKDLHIELNCDLVYINHSCSPTLVFDMSRWEIKVNPDLEGGLKVGDELTFFYPSTEWDMAQPFDCHCAQPECRGRISGAKDMPEMVLRKYWLNPHIEELLLEKKTTNGNGSA
ncbi:hypothetical protein EJ04DRAFT_512525 [Polyplosphaeria fusca]|uniref:Post-SET domain-containing protein n=1 Tax=Polyplosphaeria fusca TaxID=682080 RepID=A0A9P4R086_9PLEO|nr:hypothetical protein EJ04DRAFT_512525 [Polyplosphaeria fusca]